MVEHGALRIGALLVAVAAFGACDNGRPTRTEAKDAAETTSEVGLHDSAPSYTTSAPPTTSESGIGGCALRTNSAAFDDRAGTYAVEIADVQGRGITFDVVQWLSGADAAAEYERQRPGEGGPPNDYVIVNDNPRLRTAQAATNVQVLLVDLVGDGSPDLDGYSFAEFAERPRYASNTYWLTFKDGTVQSICEQYRP